MIVATVLKSGGIYRPDHVRMLEAQLGAGVRLTVYTDDRSVIAARGALARPLEFDLPGWWSKMELFNPAWLGDIVFFDLDTVILRRPSMFDAPIVKPMILRDFYRPEGLQSSVMCIPHRFKAQVWEHWTKCANDWMKLFGKDGLGDQAFLEHCSYSSWGILQDRYHGEFVSWKADGLEEGPLPSAARVIVFHGRPKPWDIPHAKQSWRD